VRLEAGAWVARMAEGAADVERAQALRHLCFRAARGLTAEPGREADRFDAWCQHLMIEDRAGRLVGGFRALILPANQIAESYSGQFYDLAPLARRYGRVLELGRFCTHPEARHPEILRLALAAITRMVDMGGVGLMFGCSSFEGADPLRHGQALAYLGRHHRAPFGAGPGRGSAEAVALPDLPFDAKGAEAGLPPLLRSYLALGGWVSDHAVIDRDLDTLHVLTAVEVATIPPARTRALRALAREGQNS